jgi:hypothetical protein
LAVMVATTIRSFMNISYRGDETPMVGAVC